MTLPIAAPQPADAAVTLTASHSTAEARLVIAKVSRHLLWFLFLLFVVSFLDRINIGFAGLTMMKDLGLTGTQFGLATTLFYLAYIACGVPSNAILARVGARRWIAAIMVAWGVASTATLFATDAHTLYWLRVLVGITEAGFLPGMLLYLTFWFPTAYRARANALFMIAMPVTAAFGSAASGLILGMDGLYELKGWQWLFLLEGLPASVLGVIVYFYLNDTPAQARWLSPGEKQTLAQMLAAEHRADPVAQGFDETSCSLWSELTSAAVLKFSLAYFCLVNRPRHGSRVDTADRQELRRRRHQHHDRAAGGDSPGMHDHRHDLVGPALGPRAGAPLAHRPADAVRGGRLAADGVFVATRGATAGRVSGFHRRLYRHVHLLDHTGPCVELRRACPGHRGDQRDRQPWLRSQSAGRGLAEGRHAQFQHRPALRGCPAGGGQRRFLVLPIPRTLKPTT